MLLGCVAKENLRTPQGFLDMLIDMSSSSVYTESHSLLGDAWEASVSPSERGLLSRICRILMASLGF